jgi:hypothetical protein
VTSTVPASRAIAVLPGMNLFIASATAIAVPKSGEYKENFILSKSDFLRFLYHFKI